jgi:hypothetical protein
VFPQGKVYARPNLNSSEKMLHVIADSKVGGRVVGGAMELHFSHLESFPGTKFGAIVDGPTGGGRDFTVVSND